MTIEVKILAWTVLLGILQVLIAAALGTQQRGLKWNVGNRDGTPKPLVGAAARAERASRNFLETFPFFAAVVLAVVLTKHNTGHTALGAQLYFWGAARLLSDLHHRYSVCAHSGVRGFFMGNSAAGRGLIVIEAYPRAALCA